MDKYYLMPCGRQNQKSFGCKAVVEVGDDGTKVLYSYMTKIAKITTGGLLVRLWLRTRVQQSNDDAPSCGVLRQQWARANNEEGVELNANNELVN